MQNGTSNASTPVMIPPFHDPKNLTAEQYGASDGWRLLRVGELVPQDGERYSCYGWKYSGQRGAPHGIETTYRTRTPDPFALKDAWVIWLESKPVQADFPVLCSTPQGAFGIFNYPFSGNGWTHWKQFRVTPPARELTQAEKDQEAFDKFTGAQLKCGVAIWHAALAYERARTAGK